MVSRSASASGPTGRILADWPVWLLVCTMVAIELVLELSDRGIGPARLRGLAYHYGGFWPGLLHGWQPNYPEQPWLMFLTYGFLHGGPGHLAMNMVTLWSLGRIVLERLGTARFFLLYLGVQLGGAAGYGLLSAGPLPMVGASGALFGLAGAILAWEYRARVALHEQLWPVLRIGLYLVAMNVVMWWAMNGNLAWETHLGGFLTGWALAGFSRGTGDEAPAA